MWRILVFLIFLIASVVLGIEIVKHPGYFLIIYQPWLLQIPLWLGLLALLLTFVVFYLLIDSIAQMHFMWYRVHHWWKLRREHKSYNATQHALMLLIEGRALKAEKLFLAGVPDNTCPLLNYLGAAFAAFEQKAYERRDSYLQKAHAVTKEADMAIGIVKAEMDIAEHHHEQAAATLNHLRQLSPSQPRVLKLLEKVYVHLGDWQHLLELLPSLRKAKLLTKEQQEQFDKNVYSEILKSTPIRTREELDKIWYDIPKAQRKHPDVVYAYAKQLAHFPEAQKDLEELIRQTLKNHWHPGLVNLYSTLPLENPNRQLVVVGAWLKTYGSKQEILIALGKICVKVQLWGKAKDYFERALAQGPSPEASLEYGKLAESLGESEQALKIYRQGLVKVSGVS